MQAHEEGFHETTQQQHHSGRDTEGSEGCAGRGATYVASHAYAMVMPTAMHTAKMPRMPMICAGQGGVRNPSTACNEGARSRVRARLGGAARVPHLLH